MMKRIYMDLIEENYLRFKALAKANKRTMKDLLLYAVNAAETKPQPQRSILKTTSEQIVRDFRMNEGFNTYEAARSLRPLCRRIRRPFFLIRWFNAIITKSSRFRSGSSG